ncbi:PAS domain-containing protein [bacterium]|nr:PAS domain-containing protein [bacterium]
MPARGTGNIGAQLLRLLGQGYDWQQVQQALPELADPVVRKGLLAEAERLEQAWLASEILEHLPEMIFVKEAEHLRFVLLNRAAEEVLGFSRQEMLGKTDYDFFPADEASFFQEKDRQVLASGESMNIPQEQVLARGGLRRLATQKIPLVQPGQDAYLVGVSRDITDFVKAQEEVARSQELLRRLSAQLQQAQEDERQRLARELHDELGQVLTGVRIELAWLERRLPEQPLELGDHLDRAQALVRSALTTVRRVATALRPQILDDLGLQSAIDWLLQEVCGRAGLQVALSFGLQFRLAPELSTTIYRACQEAFTNIVRHSGASRASVRIYAEDPDWVVTEVADDGRGVQSPPEGSLGLVGLRERVQLHGGKLDLLSSPEEGTRLVFRLPLGSSQSSSLKS